MDGGSPIISYTIAYGVSTGNYSATIVVTSTSHTVTSLTAGVTYKFKVLASNVRWDSLYSSEVTELAAQIPDRPYAPTTTIKNTNQTLTIAWQAPFNQGSALLAYKITIKAADGSYSEDLTNCNGQNLLILANARCDVPIAALRSSSVYNLPWGSSVWAKIIAYNKYGQSLESPEGNGARILTIPDSPTALTETVSLRSATTITFSWTAPATNGGDPVLDYRVNTDNSNGTWSVLVQNL